MKKLFYSIFAVAMAAMTFTSCEDVPAPYELPTDGGGAGPVNPTDNVLPYTSASCKDWTVVTPKGVAWSLGSTYAKASGYADGVTSETETWLVSPAITLNTSVGAIVDLEHVIRYTKSDADLLKHKLFITDAFDGDVTAATWTEIAYKPVASATNTWDFYASNTIQVPEQFLNKAVYFAFRFTCGSDNSTTWEVKNFNVKEGTGGDSDVSGGGNTPSGAEEGDGTQANPFNCAAAIKYVSALAKDVEDTKDIYIKGKIVSIAVDKNGVAQNFDNGTYGNASFYISDDGTENGQFYVFRTLYLGNEKWESGAGDIAKVGDEVIICGKTINYMGTTPETSANKSYLYSLNGKTERNGGGGGTTPTDKGTATNPYTVAEALTAINALADNGYSDTEVYTKGIVVKVTTNQTNFEKYGNLNYLISDDGQDANTLTVYSGDGLNGAKFTGIEDLKPGDVVVVYGKLQKFVKNGNTTPEIAKGNYLYSLNSGSGGGGGSTSGYLTNGNFETWADGLPTGWKSASTASSATLSQSTDAHGGSYSCNINGNATSNKRLASAEITLPAGTYTFSFYIKATTSNVAQVRPGYVPVKDGTAGTYTYGDYANISNSWQQVSYEFTLDAETTVCLVVMNPKKSSYSSGEDVLIDDAVLTKK